MPGISPSDKEPSGSAGDKPAGDRREAMCGFVGREEESAELRRSLKQDRLVTLTGPPGIGKSRLALEVARGLQRDYADGAHVVELAVVGNAGGAYQVVASTLSLQDVPGGSPTDALVAHLRDRHVLLVLDNCEHLLDACAELARTLLSECPKLSILATSREPLGVGGEAVRPVPPLAVPPAEALEPELLGGYPAVRLFVDCAHAVNPGFALNAYVGPAVAEVCRRLDGIPLAIELAAAHIEQLTPAEVARGLDNRFGLLTGGGSELPHHGTLLAALDWSHELLTEAERTLLRRISVFAGGFALGAAETVCSGGEVAVDRVPELLALLVSRSLLIVDTDGPDEARYRQLETVRVYARGKLDESGETVGLREAHARYHLALAERAEPELTGRDQEDWFEGLERARPNLRTAIEWSLGRGHDELAIRLAGALTIYWRVRCHFREGRELLEAALAASNGAAPGDARPTLVRAKALWGAGFMALMEDDPDGAIPPLEAALAGFSELGDRRGRARALLLLGNCKQLKSYPGSSSLSLLEQSAELAREANDSWCLAHALGIAGLEHCLSDELAAARPLFEECVAVAREAEDKQGLRLGLLGLGEVAGKQGDRQSSEPLLIQAVALADELGEDYSKSRALQELGRLAFVHGDYARARALLDEALSLVREVAPAKLVPPLIYRARVARAEGEGAAARRLLEEALTLARTDPDLSDAALILREIGELALEDGDVSEARRLLEESLELARACRDKRRVAAALYGLGELARAEGKARPSVGLHREALELRREIGDEIGIIESLEALAGLAARAGAGMRAGELYGAASALRDVGGHPRAPWATARCQTQRALLEEALSAEEIEAALASGAALSLEAAVERALTNTGTGREEPADGWASLSERERQVAALVAEGLTNSEIAKRLLISFGTVKDHLSHTFTKLGIKRRVELAQEVFRRERHSGRDRPK